MILHSLVSGMNGAVVNSIAPGDLSSCQQPAIVQIAYYPGPFACSLGAQIQTIQEQAPVGFLAAGRS